jgi:hypothetical protein
MKNIVKFLLVTIVSALVFTACNKEGDLPLYLAGNGTVVSTNVPSVTATVADSNKTALTVNWTWPNYATDSINQKFIVQIDSAGHKFVKPVTRTVKGVSSTSFTAKELNEIVFGFGDVKAPYTLEMRVVSSYANNNEQYTSNSTNVVVTPYIIPVTLTLAPTGPLTLVVGDAIKTAVIFHWNATKFGNVPLNYAVQIDKSGSTWATPTVIKYGAALTGRITVNDLNNAAINAGMAPTASGDLVIRVIAYQGDNFANPLYSNIKTLTVTTYLAVMTWYVPGDYVVASYPGTTMKDWDPATSPQVKSTSTAPTRLEGYVYMANATNHWKFATKPNWDGPNYGAGATAGTLDAAGGDISATAGYYKLNADAATLTYTAVATTWGVIGDATPLGWNDETALTFNPSTQTWTGGITLTAAKFKFRANHSWDYNYGSTAANSTLDFNGSDIPVSLAADYFFTLDLSHPNEYTYSANRWGLIGDATPGGWNSDENMTWDATSKALKVTLNLTVGKIKFRANDDWALNLGGDIAALTVNGADISIAAAGNYTITLYLSGTPNCTIVKN